MFCENCGKKLQEGVLFCTECGAKVNQAVPPTTETSTEEAASQQQKPKKNNKLPLIIVAVILVVALVIGTIIFLGGSDDSKDDDSEDLVETEIETEESEETEIETEMHDDDTKNPVYANYSDIVAEMSTGSYIVEDSAYEEIAFEMGRVVVDAGLVEVGNSCDVSVFTEEQKGRLNYNILNELSYLEEYEIPTSDHEIEGEETATALETSILADYIASFYEGASVVGYYNALVVCDDYVAFYPSDGGEWTWFYTYTISEMDGYIMIEAPCYEMDNAGEVEYKFDARVLFKVTDGEPFALQLVHVEKWTNTINISSVSVSSQLDDYNGKTYGAENLFDGDISTAWVENASGVGVGETITIDLGSVQKVSDLLIYNGYLGSYYLYDINGKVATISIDFGNGVSADYDLCVEDYYSTEKKDIEFAYVGLLNLYEPVWTDQITITITGAVPGSSYSDTCISEIEIH